MQQATSLFAKGIDKAAEANALDHQDRFKDALSSYVDAIEYFLAGLRCSKDKKVNALVRRKVKEFLDRSEQLKALVAANRQTNDAAPSSFSKQAPVPAPAEGHNAELRRALESTILVHKEKLTWNDVAGLQTAKQMLEEAVMLPHKFPQLFTEKRKPWKGILLYGPPGTGKTHLAKVVASMTNARFYSVSSADLVSKYMGDAERLVKELFAMAQETKPSVIFIDEIDSICGKRESGDHEAITRMKNEFLLRMQENVIDKDGVLVIAATNRPYDLDTAMLRRFEKRIYIPLPDVPARQHLFQLHVGNEPVEVTATDLEQFASMTEGFSGSDIAVLCQEALMQPVRDCLKATHWRQVGVASGGRPVMTPCAPTDHQAIPMNMMDLDPETLVVPPTDKSHFLGALQRLKPSVSASELQVYDRFTQEFGMDGTRALDEDEDEAEHEQEKEKEKEKETEEDQKKRSTSSSSTSSSLVFFQQRKKSKPTTTRRTASATPKREAAAG
ncbi:Vacuolar protein sorting-associated protein 4 [Balamuthia mandrillaris]